MIDGKQVTVCFHVDDLLVTSKLKTNVDQVINELETKFNEITVTRGVKHSYLSMNIVQSASKLEIDMIGYVKKITVDVKADLRRMCPANDDLFNIDSSSTPLSNEDRESFHTKVAQLLYLAKRARLDLLTAVSHLAGRVSCPNEDENRKLSHVLSYLVNTRERKMILKSTGATMEFVCYIDASYGGEDDATSRSGVIIYVCGVALLGWSPKQKLIVKSACESEIVALSDGLSHVLWVRNLMKEQYRDTDDMEPTVVIRIIRMLYH